MSTKDDMSVPEMVDNSNVVNEIGNKYPSAILMCAVPVLRNPLYESPLNKVWSQWVFESSNMSKKMFTKLKEIDLLTAYSLPLCEDTFRYECTVKMMYMYFVLDDHTDCVGGDAGRDQDQTSIVWAQFGQVLDELEGKQYVSTIDWKPYVFAAHSLMKEMYRSFNNEQKRRIIKNWRIYMKGNIEETLFFNQKKKFDNVEQYLKMRVKSIAAMAIFQFIEFTDQLALPEQVYEGTKMQRLFSLAAFHTICVNDSYSFEKELKDSDNDLDKVQNIVAVISKVNKLTIDESMQKLNTMFDKNEKELIELEAEITNDPGCLQVTKDYIKSLNYMLGGHLKVLQLMDRYNKNE